MELSKQRKLSLGVLGLALTALAADRIFFGAASPASASASEAAPATTEPVGMASSPKPAGPTLAGLLETIAGREEIDSQHVEDVFAKPERPSLWRLTTTFGVGDRAGVVIDGETVRIGGRHGGAELISVSRDGAVFRRDGTEFFVRIGGEGG